MSADEPAKLRPFRGSVLHDGIVVRITARCLREDLGLPAPADMQHVLETVSDAIAATDGPGSTSLNLSLPARLSHTPDSKPVVYSETDRVRWILAHGLEASKRCIEMDISGRLWPSSRDRSWLEQDSFAMGLRRLQVDAPLALAQARQQKGRACKIPGPTGHITVVVDEATGTTYAAIGAEFLSEMDRRALRRFALVLACLLPDQEWKLCSDEIGTTVPLELDHYGPPHPHLIFCNAGN